MTLPKGFCECGHTKEFHSDLDNKCTQCQCVKFGKNKQNRYCDCGHQQSNHLENFNECTQCNCKKLRIHPDSKPKPSKPKPSKKVKFLVGIWVIVVALEIILPVNYWVENFGWGFYGKADYGILVAWTFGFIFIFFGGLFFFDWKWKVLAPYEKYGDTLAEWFVACTLTILFTIIMGGVGYMLFEWVGGVSGVVVGSILWPLVFYKLHKDTQRA